MKKLLIIFIILISLIIGVSAEGNIKLTVIAEIVKWDMFSGASFDNIKQWLASSKLALDLSDDISVVQLIYKNEPMLSIYKTKEGFQLDDKTWYEGDENAFYKLLAQDNPLYNARQYYAAYSAIAPSLKNICTRLDGYKETKKGGSAIKKVGKPAYTEEYSISALELGTVWYECIDFYAKYLQDNGADTAFIQETSALLSQITFGGNIKLVQMLDSNMQPIAWRFNGDINIYGADTRKASILFAKNDEGLYAKIAFPAKKGKNALDINIAGSNKDRKFAMDGNFKRNLEGETSNGSFDISLTLSQGISGKADIKLKFGKEPQMRYTLRPKLDSAYRGTLSFVKEYDKRKLDMLFTILDGEKIPFNKGLRIVDIESLTDEQIAIERDMLSYNNSQKLYILINDVSEEVRNIVLHEITRHSRLI